MINFSEYDYVLLSTIALRCVLLIAGVYGWYNFKKRLVTKDITLASVRKNKAIKQLGALFFGTLAIVLVLGISALPLLALIAVISILAKGYVSDILSWISICYHDSFRVGETIELCEQGLKGKVKRIDYISTEMISDDGSQLRIPNRYLSNKPIGNLSRKLRHKMQLSFSLSRDSIKSIDEKIACVRGYLKQRREVDHTSSFSICIDEVCQESLLLNIEFNVLETGSDRIGRLRTTLLIELIALLDAEGAKQQEKVLQNI